VLAVFDSPQHDTRTELDRARGLNDRVDASASQTTEASSVTAKTPSRMASPASAGVSTVRTLPMPAAVYACRAPSRVRLAIATGRRPGTDWMIW